MADDVNLTGSETQQAADAAPPAEPASAPGPAPEQSHDWEGRYNGAMRILQHRDKQIKELQEKLETASGSVGDLTAQLEALQASSAAKETSLGEQLTTLTTERDTARQELTTARAELLKFSALKEYPDLLSLADAIPALPDEEAMKEYLAMMAKGVTDLATTKAQQLTAGMTPGPTAPAEQTHYAYSTLDEWQFALNAAAGNPDRQEWEKVTAAFKQWEAKQP